MSIYLTVILLALSTTLRAQETELMQNTITNPVMSMRCKELFKERNEKIRTQQRLNGLVQRNNKVMNKTPESKQGLKARLKANQVKINNELYLVNQQIQTMEENIVRSGCPGLSL